MRGPLPAVVVIVVSSITANAQVTPQPPDYARSLIELAEDARLQAVGSGALAAARFDDAVRERFGEPDGAGPTAYVNSVLKLMVDDARDEESPELRFLTARDRLRTSLHQQLLDGRPLNASDPFTGTCVTVVMPQRAETPDIQQVMLVRQNRRLRAARDELKATMWTNTSGNRMVRHSGTVCWSVATFRLNLPIRMVLSIPMSKPVEIELDDQHLLHLRR